MYAIKSIAIHNVSTKSVLFFHGYVDIDTNEDGEATFGCFDEDIVFTYRNGQFQDFGSNVYDMLEPRGLVS